MADGTPNPSSEVAFTPAVKAVQARRGSRDHYARVEADGGFRTAVTPDLAGFLREARSFYLATASAGRRRVKLWGRARVVQDDEALLARLWPEGYKARPEQVIVFEIEAWDTNCPQHIPQMFHAEDVARTVVELQGRINALEAELAALKAGRA
jgi:hypothetical protein